jgi:hypothetical protein
MKEYRDWQADALSNVAGNSLSLTQFLLEQNAPFLAYPWCPIAKALDNNSPAMTVLMWHPVGQDELFLHEKYSNAHKSKVKKLCKTIRMHVFALPVFIEFERWSKKKEQNSVATVEEINE